MRRFLGVLVGMVFLALVGCGEVDNPSILDAPGPEGIPTSTAPAIFDGTTPDVEGANEHFFFLQPVAEETPAYSGVADDFLEPVVEVCDITNGNWNAEAEACASDPYIVFTTDPGGLTDPILVDPGTGYHVVWQTKDEGLEVTAGNVYRVSVSVLDNLLGYADVTAFSNQVYSGHHNTEPGVIAISDNGSMNIAFRIEDGALEEEYCDTSVAGVQDCDVQIVTPGTQACLQVFNDPEAGVGAELGSEVCIEETAQPLDSEGNPIENDFVVILTLEQNNNPQGDFGGNGGWQLPYFPDVRTDPPGINFVQQSAVSGAQSVGGEAGFTTGEGIDLVICQPNFEDGGLPNDFHFNPNDPNLPPGWQATVRPFFIYSDAPGVVVFPDEYTYSSSACEGYSLGGATGSGEHPHPVASALPSDDADGGWLTRLASGLSAASGLFLPEPLNARRLHGGLNTTVYDTRGDDSADGGDGGPANVAGAFALGEEGSGSGGPYVVEAGAILDVNAEMSTYEGAAPGAGTVGTATTLFIGVRDVAGVLFPFPEDLGVSVGVEVQGANGTTIGAISGDDISYNSATGFYEATYTPVNPGTDSFLITIDGVAIGPDGAELPTYEVAPVGASAGTSSFSVSASEAGSPVTVVVDVNDTNGDDYTYGYNENWAPEVLVTVSGANNVSGINAYDNTDENGDGVSEGWNGTYVATYTPQTYGTDQVSVTINGEAVTTGDTDPFTTAPRPADASKSTVSAPDGLVESPTTVTVTVYNTADFPPGEIYDYGDIRPISVLVSVSGANERTDIPAYDNTDEDGDGVSEGYNGTYIATYTPLNDGDDFITATVAGAQIPEANSATSKVFPLSGDLTINLDVTEVDGGVSLFNNQVPENDWTVELYEADGDFVGMGTTNGDGQYTFVDQVFGDYVVHFPYRDFDVYFDADPDFPQGMSWKVTHDQKPNTYTVTGQQQAPDRPTAQIHRLGFGGDGNAHDYVDDGRSWIASDKQAVEEVLRLGAETEGVFGHLATITSRSANEFIKDFFFVDPDMCAGQNRCRIKAWIGLTDSDTEGTYLWVNNEGEATASTFLGWSGWEIDPSPPAPTSGNQGNRDHVEIDSTGTWETINGANSTNDGYFVEFEVPEIFKPFGA